MDWLRVLQARSVPHTVRGREIELRCPFCGGADPSMHMNISLVGRGWHCWRNAAHSGRSPVRLLQGLLHITRVEAETLAGYDPNLPPREDLRSELERVITGNERASRPRRLTLPKEFKLLTREGLGEAFWEYMVRRGFDDEDVLWLVERYDLHYAITGRFRYRVIVPVRSYDGALVSWTGRSIGGHHLRYDTPKVGVEPGMALSPPGDHLLGVDWLKRGRVLIVAEGPFDAMRISALGRRHGIFGTCLFGLRISDGQETLLERLRPHWHQIIPMLDAEAWSAMMRVQQRGAGVMDRRNIQLPAFIKDPGELTRNQFEDIVVQRVTGAGNAEVLR